MAARLVVCPECGAEVANGRLSCAACGTLLASVAGAARRFSMRPVGETGSEPPTMEPAVPTGAGIPDAPVPAAPVEPPSILRDWTGPIPASVVAAEAAGTLAEAPSATTSSGKQRGILRRGARSAPVASPADTAASAPVTSMDLPSPVAAPAWPVGQEERAFVDAEVAEEEGEEVSSLLPDDDSIAPIGASAARATSPVPGGYVAPSLIPAAAATTAMGRPATAAAIAAASITAGTVASIPAPPRENRWFSVPRPAAAEELTPGKSGLFSDLPFDAPDDIAGWATAIGGLLGAVAFVLPSWAENGVIGFNGLPRDYFTRWGLANAADLVPMAASIAILLLTILPNGFPRTIRRVALPILFGGWFFGVAWSYATGPFGLGWGVDAFGIASLLLVAGGIVALVRPEPVETEAAEGPQKD